jgi:hypothetical protein
MRGVIKILVVLVPVTLIGGVVIHLISHARNIANIHRCQSNLKQIGIALHNYQATFNRLPSATVPNAELSADQRLSWMTEIWPGFMEGGIATKFDKSKAWDAAENCPVVLRFRQVGDDGQHGYGEELLGEFKAFLCPSNASRNGPGLPGPTHFVGISGVGEDAADLPLSDRRVGFFGYDRTVSLESIKDGISSTLLVVEIGDSGPWTVGGQATVRGLASGRPYLGEGGQFSSHHRDTALVTNVLLGDGSVYPFSSSVSSKVFEAMATISGGEEVCDLPR